MKVAVLRGFRKGSKVLRGKDGHLYHFNRKMDGGRLSFRCCYSYRLQCRGRCSIAPSGRGFLSNRKHNHLPSKGAVELRRFRHVVLHRCRSKETTSFKTIYHQERKRLKIPKSMMAHLPLKTIRPSMRKARMTKFPKSPHTISALAKLLSTQKWKHLTTALDKKDSILAAAGGKHEDRTQFILFSSRRMIKYLKEVTEVFSDGTFCTPAKLQCSQVWNIVTVRRNHTICLARVLMESRKTKCYVRVLKALKRLQKKLKPKSVMADFEKSQQKGWAKVFPNAKRLGCHFHCNKNMIKRAKKAGLTRLIKHNKVVNELVGCLCSLPLLPDHLIDAGFKWVLRRTGKKGYYAKLAPLLDYVLNTWIRGENREILSVYRCPDRTSNVCESDNASLRALLFSKHPSVWALLAAFVLSEDNAALDVVTLDGGENPTPARRASALANDTKLAGLWDDLDGKTMSVGKFLCQASKTVRGVINKTFLRVDKKKTD